MNILIKYKNKLNNTSRSGFTLVELLVAIAVMGILIAITVVSYSAMQYNAAESAVQSDLSQIGKKLELDGLKQRKYPTSLQAIDGGAGIESSPSTAYTYGSDGDSFCLSAASVRYSSLTFRMTSGGGDIEDGNCDSYIAALEDGGGDQGGNPDPDPPVEPEQPEEPSGPVPGEWTAHEPPESATWTAIAYGNGTFVAVSSNASNRVMTSPDGYNWTPRSAPAQAWNDVTFADGRFVAVSSNGTNRVMTSSDGINWTSRSAADAASWNGVAFGNGRLVAVASSGAVRLGMHSSNGGQSWAQSNNSAQQASWNNVVFGDGRFVAIAHTAPNMSSTRVKVSTNNGANWTGVSMPTGLDNPWRDIAYGNGRYVAVTNLYNTRLMHSTNGTSWTGQSVEASGWNGVAYGNNKFVAVADSGDNRIMSSPDGVNWTAESAPEQNNWRTIGYGDGCFVALSSDTSSNEGSNLVMTMCD